MIRVGMYADLAQRKHSMKVHDEPTQTSVTLVHYLLSHLWFMSCRCSGGDYNSTKTMNIKDSTSILIGEMY